MDADVAIPVVGLIVSACVAVGVPYLTFSHSRKLERVRLLGVERFRLYVDALTEAHADITWLEDRVYTTVYANEEMLPKRATRMRLPWRWLIWCRIRMGRSCTSMSFPVRSTSTWHWPDGLMPQ